MGLINPAYAQSISPQRPVETFGEEVFTDLDAIQAVVLTHRGLLFVPRGSDLKAHDRFLWQERMFRVLDYPAGDMDHPFTGDDFGWVSYTIEAAT